MIKLINNEKLDIYYKNNCLYRTKKRMKNEEEQDEER